MKKKTALICLLTALSATTIAVAAGCTTNEHTHSYSWKSDSEQHWEECGCGDKQSAGEHEDADTSGTCDKCGLADSNVTFDMQGHGTQVPAQVVFLNAKAVEPSDEPEDAGYAFGGWYTDAACETPFDFDAPVTTDVTVYAKWTVTVTFNMKGHGAAVDAQPVKVGGTAVKPANDPVDENHEYLFEGWCSDEDCDTPYDFTAAVSENITLYAKWVPDTRPLVTFDLDEKADGTALGKRVDVGSKVEKPDDPEVFHYIFDGWYTSDEYETEFDFDNTEITADTTIYAKLTYDRRVYVTFDVLGHGTVPAMQIVEHGETVVLPDDPSEEGYVFGGWYTSPSFRDYFDEFLPEDEMTDDITLYAKWMVTVFFHLDDGTPAHVDVKVGDVISEQYLVPGPNGDFDFGGWYTDPEYKDEFVTTTPINVKTDLYAKWVPAMPKLELEAFNLYTFGSEDTLQFSFTAPSAGRYKIEPYNVKTFSCYFTTDIDEEGVYYGEGYDANEKIFRLTAGQKIIVTLYRGESIADTDKVSLSVSEVEDDFPDNWVSGTYTDGQITIEFNKEDKTVKWDDVTYPVRYSEQYSKATFKYGSYTCEIKQTAKDTFMFQYHATSKVTVVRVEKQERLSVDKFSGVYEPVNAAGNPTTKLGSVSKVVVYESGNGYLTIRSTNEAYKLGEGASYVYDGLTNVLQYENYRITANLDGDGKVVSISISNPNLTNGSVPIVYTRTDDAPDEPPENLPLPNNIELIGATYFIKNGRWGSNSKPEWDYGITITAYDKNTGTYTVSCNGSTYKLKIQEGADDAITVYVYDIATGNLTDTLEKKVVKSNVLIMDGTNNEVTPDMVSNDFVIYTIPKTGIFSVTVLDASPKDTWGDINPIMFYPDYENNPNGIYIGCVEMASEKFVLQQDNKFAVGLADYGSKFQSLTFILTEAVPDPGSTPEDAIVINGADSKTSAVTMDGNHYAKFIAAEAGTYKITLTYEDWWTTYNTIDYTVDGKHNGVVEPDWDSGNYSYYYYRDGVSLEDLDAWNAAPYATVTVTAGQEVSIVFVGHSYYENVTITIEKV